MIKRYRSIASAYRNGSDLDVARAVALKYAKVLDVCESARDVKPLATGLLETIDRIRAYETRDKETAQKTPLMKVLGQKRKDDEEYRMSVNG